MGMRLVTAVACLAVIETARAQVYVWRDPASGVTRVSNFAPAWYARNQGMDGPRVVVTLGSRIVDDTSLPLEARLELAARSAAASPQRPRPETPPASPQPPAASLQPPAAPSQPMSETARLVHEAAEAEARHRLSLARGDAELERRSRAAAERARQLADEAMRRDSERELAEESRQ